MRFAFLAAACAALIMTAPVAAAAADSPDAAAAAQKEIWSKEQAVYAGRASGSMANYELATHPAYMAWPPFAEKPFRASGLKRNQPMINGGKEKLQLIFDDFTISGDTALIYYHTHRTALGDGTPVDEIWETVHVWKKDGPDWKVMGGMSRLRPKR